MSSRLEPEHPPAQRFVPTSGVHDFDDRHLLRASMYGYASSLEQLQEAAFTARSPWCGIAIVTVSR